MGAEHHDGLSARHPNPVSIALVGATFAARDVQRETGLEAAHHEQHAGTPDGPARGLGDRIRHLGHLLGLRVGELGSSVMTVDRKSEQRGDEPSRGHGAPQIATTRSAAMNAKLQPAKANATI